MKKKSIKIPEPFEHFDETWSKDLKLQGLKIRQNELSCKIWFLNKIQAGEVVYEPHGVPAEEAASHHRWEGQAHKQQPDEMCTQQTFFGATIAYIIENLT